MTPKPGFKVKVLFNKKAQLMLAYPRDAKTMKKIMKNKNSSISKL